MAKEGSDGAYMQFADVSYGQYTVVTIAETSDCDAIARMAAAKNRSSGGLPDSGRLKRLLRLQ